MPEIWSREEVEAAVTDYFEMLALELSAKPFNKAERNRQLQQKLNRRSHGSIERKHQNISAILIESGYPTLKVTNRWEIIRSSSVLLSKRVYPQHRMSKASWQTLSKSQRLKFRTLTTCSQEVDPPTRDEKSSRIREQPQVARRPTRRNYLELEARNSSLRRAGEELAVRFEQERLRRIGEPKLAANVQQVALTLGDHLGYDIVSFERDGRERLIEVKTTRFGVWTPFFASHNEVNVSEQRAEQYQLYRIFAFDAQPRLFALAGSLRKTCRLDPYTYSALPA